MTHLLLHYYENKWLLDTKNKDLHKARLFRNTFRFIDDLCAITTIWSLTGTFRIYILQSYNSKRKRFQLPKHHF